LLVTGWCLLIRKISRERGATGVWCETTIANSDLPFTER
jgi:hypothetical protein